MKKGYITKKDLIKICNDRFNLEITRGIIDFYSRIYKLIESGQIKRVKGITGSISLYPEDTPKILYTAITLKECGYKIKLSEMNYWLNLLNLSEESIKEIKKIQNEDENFNENLEFEIGITPEQKKYLLKNYPLKLFDYKKLITRFDILKRVIKERAYAELDFTDLKIETSEDINKLENSLDNPEINLDLDMPEIKVIYKKPISKEIVFKKNSLIEVIIK